MNNLQQTETYTHTCTHTYLHSLAHCIFPALFIINNQSHNNNSNSINNNNTYCFHFCLCNTKAPAFETILIRCGDLLRLQRISPHTAQSRPQQSLVSKSTLTLPQCDACGCSGETKTVGKRVSVRWEYR